jgi:tRNA(Ile)-lysidine synthase
MIGFSAATLHAALAALGSELDASHYCVALSGGADSTALLHCLTQLRAQHAGFELRAIHVNHHLQPHADLWAEHCAGLAKQLGVRFLVLDARVQAVRGGSLEAAARDARYRLLAEALAPGELLLTAHQAEDQLETLLLQLARGAGVAGLAGMPRRTACGRGEHLRPLLDFNRRELQRYVTAAGLTWIEDPSNDDERFDRNFVRHRILPALGERWPSLAASAVRSADHLASAHTLLDDLARADHAVAAEGDQLRVTTLRGLEAARMRNLLRFWIRLRDASLPSSAILEQIEAQMLALRADSTPEVQWGDHVMRRYRDRLYLGRRLPAEPAGETSWRWKLEPELALPAGSGRLRARVAECGGPRLAGIPDELQIRWRSGGENLQLAANRPHRELRSLMQEWGIVPWMRARIPLLYAGEVLVAIGDLWLAAEFRAAEGQQGILLEWFDHPALD